jgi:hypothetical protein
MERMSYVKEYNFCMKNFRNRDDGLGFLRCYSDKFTLVPSWQKTVNELCQAGVDAHYRPSPWLVHVEMTILKF